MKKITFLFRRDKDFNEIAEELRTEGMHPKMGVIQDNTDELTVEIIDGDFDEDDLDNKNND